MTADESNTNSADRLLQLIESMQETLDTTIGGSLYSGRQLHDVMPRIANDLGFASYLELVSTFLRYCDAVEGGIKGLPLTKERVRDSHLKKLNHLKGVFDAPNFTIATGSVMQKYFTELHLDALVEISERFETHGVRESSMSAVSDALRDAEELFSDISNDLELSARARSLFRLHFSLMQQIVDTFERFGEQDFWDHYRVIFSAFTEIQVGMAPQKRAKFSERLSTVFRHLLDGSTLGANSAAIAEAGNKLLKLLSEAG